MIMKPLTIVIPTRNRPVFLEKCLRSVFEQQTVNPKVIVSDNSTSTCDVPAIHALQKQYPFDYVRQSGELDQTAHLKICMLELPSSPWVLLLHDDDEFCPGAVEKIELFLQELNVGIVLAGIQQIDQDGRQYGQWIPKFDGTFSGEEALLRIGLDGCPYPPGTIFNVATARQLGGFIGIDGVACDHLFALQMAYHHGAALFPEVIGRYRSGPHQIFHVSKLEEAASWLDFELRQVELIRTLPCSAGVLDRLIDYRTWSVFLAVVPYCLQSRSSALLRLTRRCLKLSPQLGEWQNRVRNEYPFLFSRVRWHSWSLVQAAKMAIRIPLRWLLREGH
jgi:glycosyltransferase involved in cell wall biosynthesis